MKILIKFYTSGEKKEMELLFSCKTPYLVSILFKNTKFIVKKKERKKNSIFRVKTPFLVSIHQNIFKNTNFVHRRLTIDMAMSIGTFFLVITNITVSTDNGDSSTVF